MSYKTTSGTLQCIYFLKASEKLSCCNANVVYAGKEERNIDNLACYSEHSPELGLVLIKTAAFPSSLFNWRCSSPDTRISSFRLTHYELKYLSLSTAAIIHSRLPGFTWIITLQFLPIILRKLLITVLFILNKLCKYKCAPGGNN